MDGPWWPPPPPPQPSPPLPTQMDSTNLRYNTRPFAASQLQEAAAVADGRTAAMPDQLLSNIWSSQFGGQSAKAAPSSNALLAQVPGNYYNHPHVSHVPDLKALLHNPNASNAAGAIDLTRAYSPLGGAAALPKYPSHGFSASSGVEQSSLGALFLNKSSNARGNLPGEGSAIDGMSHGAMQFQDSTVHTMQKLPSKSIPRHHHALLMDRMRVSCLNVGGFNLQHDLQPNLTASLSWGR